MPCYKPLKAFRNPSGGPLIFNQNVADVRGFNSLYIPCGRCIGCRLQYSAVWAVRCMHEADMHENNCFITLTYSDENLVWAEDMPTLVKSDLQNFLKRYRDRIGYGRFKFYGCGEYGDRTFRPHYHLCIFGHDFSDKEFYKIGGGGHKLYTSDLLDDLWSLGDCTVGSLTFDSAAYCARYVMQRITGEVAGSYYKGREPEFSTKSNRSGGIGLEWFLKHGKDVFPRDEVVMRGVSHPVPRFYYTKYEISDPISFERVRLAREGSVDLKNSTPDRLKVREEVVQRKLGHYPRVLE